MGSDIRFCTTADGVNIAYCALGEGAPLVCASDVWGDLHWYTHDDATRTQVDAMVASGLRVIKYDARGMGSSDREVTDFSLEARLRDLEAVVDHLELDRFPLCGYGKAGPTAILYALRHSKRVSHLLLVNTFASGAAYYEKFPALHAAVLLRGMADEHWEFFTLALANAVRGFGDAAGARELAALFRRSMSPAGYLSHVDESQKIDLLEALPAVSVPTLVILDTSGFHSDDAIRPLATRIPGARLVRTDHYPREVASFLGMAQDTADAADSFLHSVDGRAATMLPAASTLTPPCRDSAGLTSREVEVLRLIVAGKSGREIAAELVLSPRTVERHIANIYSKTHTHGRAQLAGFALRRNLV